MHLRSRRHILPLALVVLPIFAVGASATLNARAAQVEVSRVGTQEAPVDGQDGKPHAGPFVDSTKKKSTQQVVDLSSVMVGRGRGKTTSTADEGVMSDLSNHKEVTGPTGTEGGVSQKDRQRKENGSAEKKPEQPKADTTKTYSRSKSTDEKDAPQQRKKGAAGLEKPADLPDKPHDIPHPKPASLADTTAPRTSSTLLDDSLLHPFHSFFLSLTMIIFSEIGDKTFLVAALMAMRHARMVVFSAAFAALALMTVLSALLGHAVPTLLPKRFTGFAAAILFFVFGARLLKEGLAMAPDEGVGEEMKEVEMELEEKEAQMRRLKHPSDISPYALESGRLGRLRSNSTLPAPARSPSTSPSPPPSPTAAASISSLLHGFHNLCALLLSEAWVQTFVMTFLGEWGDRSQIATIAMAAGQDYWWITGGAVLGHGLCTAIAVVGGRAIAGKVSMRIVTLGGAVAFLVFGVVYLAESIFYS